MKRQEGFASVLIGGCWHGEAGGGKVPCYCLGEDIWLSMAGPELEAGGKIKEVKSWLIWDTEVVVWHLGLDGAEVVGQKYMFR